MFREYQMDWICSTHGKDEGIRIINYPEKLKRTGYLEDPASVWTIQYLHLLRKEREACFHLDGTGFL
jgi:hypothetical protein